MQPHRHQCPHCGLVLRVRDRKQVGRTVDCPDCGRPILVLADGPHELQLVAAEPQPAPAAADGSQVTPTSRNAAPEVVRQWGRSLTSATGVAWSVAGAAAVLLLIVAWPFGAGSSATTDGEPPQADKVEPSAIVDRDPAQPVAANGEANRRQQPADGVSARLERLGEAMLAFVAEHERFPASSAAAANLTEGERLSWLAELTAATDPPAGGEPQWDLAWRDPLNDRFVRRTLPQFQNPGLRQLTGPDGYPAAHFVGVAGVGADGPRLPAGHPRAGIFAVNRRTRLGDIRDGQAQTMMVAGVTRNIGGWASSGPATFRPFTREPYIGGPDGFGTGEKDGMSVLMADGSVRLLAIGTDPRIVRRMAAMADGLPLDLAVPGEPGDAKTIAKPEPENDPPEVGKPNPAAASVREPVAAPTPPRTIDVAGKLAQPIAEYALPQPAPLRVVLGEIEEMAGVPIRVDEDELENGADLLDKPVTLGKLKQTTVGAILDALLEQANLMIVIEKDGIRIEPPQQAQESPPGSLAP